MINRIDLARWKPMGEIDLRAAARAQDNVKKENRLFYLQAQTKLLREQIKEFKKAKYNITG